MAGIFNFFKKSKKDDPFSEWKTKDVRKELDTIKAKLLSNFKGQSLRIVLCGATGTGKSSFVNNIISTLHENIIQVANTGDDSDHITRLYREYFVLCDTDKKPVVVVCDTLGIDKILEKDNVGYLKAALDGKYASGQSMDSDQPVTKQSQRSRRKRAEHVIFVFAANMLTEGTSEQSVAFQKMLQLQRYAQDEDISMSVVITKCDELDKNVARDITYLYKSEAVDRARNLIKQRFKSLPKNRLFPIVNFMNQMELTPQMMFQTLVVLKHILWDVYSHTSDLGWDA